MVKVVRKIDGLIDGFMDGLLEGSDRVGRRATLKEGCTVDCIVG